MRSWNVATDFFLMNASNTSFRINHQKHFYPRESWAKSLSALNISSFYFDGSPKKILTHNSIHRKRPTPAVCGHRRQIISLTFACAFQKEQNIYGSSSSLNRVAAVSMCVVTASSGHYWFNALSTGKKILRTRRWKEGIDKFTTYADMALSWSMTSLWRTANEPTHENNHLHYFRTSLIREKITRA